MNEAALAGDRVGPRRTSAMPLSARHLPCWEKEKQPHRASVLQRPLPQMRQLLPGHCCVIFRVAGGVHGQDECLSCISLQTVCTREYISYQSVLYLSTMELSTPPPPPPKRPGKNQTPLTRHRLACRPSEQASRLAAPEPIRQPRDRPAGLCLGV